MPASGSGRTFRSRGPSGHAKCVVVMSHGSSIVTPRARMSRTLRRRNADMTFFMSSSFVVTPSHAP